MNSLRILSVHNRYVCRGGEDQVFENETDLLIENGHNVNHYVEDNNKIKSLSALRVALGSIWSKKTYLDVKTILNKNRYDVVHIHNFFPLISPSVYYAAHEMKVPVIQTLHNFRLICCNALLFRNGAICEDCLNYSISWPGIYHRCYRDSYIQSAITTLSFSIHRYAGTWKRLINRYIVLTCFAKEKFTAMGIPKDLILVKPNLLSEDPGLTTKTGKFVLFIGRLSEEKGIRTLLRAWQRLPNIPLKIAGEGPLRSLVLKAVDSNPQIIYAGPVSHEDIFNLIKDSRFIVVPSEWYEHFPMVTIEALSCGRPVLASRIGSLAEIITDKKNGLLFNCGDEYDLASKAKNLWLSEIKCSQMGMNARKTYEVNYSTKENYNKLESIYMSILNPPKSSAI